VCIIAIYEMFECLSAHIILPVQLNRMSLVGHRVSHCFMIFYNGWRHVRSMLGPQVG